MKQNIRKCPRGKILNPSSGRCVSIKGRIGQKILKSRNNQSRQRMSRHRRSRQRRGRQRRSRQRGSRRECPPDKILNPSSGRCVSIKGRIGQKILKSRDNQRRQSSQSLRSRQRRQSSQSLRNRQRRQRNVNDIPDDIQNIILNNMPTEQQGVYATLNTVTRNVMKNKENIQKRSNSKYKCSSCSTDNEYFFKREYEKRCPEGTKLKKCKNGPQDCCSLNKKNINNIIRFFHRASPNIPKDIFTYILSGRYRNNLRFGYALNSYILRIGVYLTTENLVLLKQYYSELPFDYGLLNSVRIDEETHSVYDSILRLLYDRGVQLSTAERQFIHRL